MVTPHVALFLDYDGTLSPIAPTPAEAQLPLEARRALADLAHSPYCSLAIVSGRSVQDLRQRIAIEPVIYAGNHGLEIAGPDWSFVTPAAAGGMAILDDLYEELLSQAKAINGVLIEHKRLTLSVHSRSVADRDLHRLGEIVHETVARFGSLLRVTTGNRVFDVRPGVDWDKGSAVLWILEHLGHPTDVCIYIGDDETDEDAFAVLPQGVTIKVAGDEPKPTQARYFVEDTNDVCRLIERLAKELCDPPLQQVQGGQYRQEAGVRFQPVERGFHFQMDDPAGVLISRLIQPQQGGIPVVKGGVDERKVDG